MSAPNFIPHLFTLPAFLADAGPPQDGSSMWIMSLKWWEFIIRALIVYGFLILILRLTGKRQIGQLAPFDLVLLLVLSNAVQNSMNLSLIHISEPTRPY